MEASVIPTDVVLVFEKDRRPVTSEVMEHIEHSEVKLVVISTINSISELVSETLELNHRFELLE